MIDPSDEQVLAACRRNSHKFFPQGVKDLDAPLPHMIRMESLDLVDLIHEIWNLGNVDSIPGIMDEDAIGIPSLKIQELIQTHGVDLDEYYMTHISGMDSSFPVEFESPIEAPKIIHYIIAQAADLLRSECADIMQQKLVAKAGLKRNKRAAQTSKKPPEMVVYQCVLSNMIRRYEKEISEQQPEWLQKHHRLSEYPEEDPALMKFEYHHTLVLTGICNMVWTVAREKSLQNLIERFVMTSNSDNTTDEEVSFFNDTLSNEPQIMKRLSNFVATFCRKLRLYMVLHEGSSKAQVGENKDMADVEPVGVVMNVNDFTKKSLHKDGFFDPPGPKMRDAKIIMVDGGPMNNELLEDMRSLTINFVQSTVVSKVKQFIKHMPDYDVNGIVNSLNDGTADPGAYEENPEPWFEPKMLENALRGTGTFAKATVDSDRPDANWLDPTFPVRSDAYITLLLDIFTRVSYCCHPVIPGDRTIRTLFSEARFTVSVGGAVDLPGITMIIRRRNFFLFYPSSITVLKSAVLNPFTVVSMYSLMKGGRDHEEPRLSLFKRATTICVWGEGKTV